MKKFKIAFLDRDGVINSSGPNNGYVGSLKHFKWVPGAIKAIKLLNNNDRSDFMNFTKNNTEYSQGNMFICKNKKIIETEFDIIYNPSINSIKDIKNKKIKKLKIHFSHIK